MTVPAQGGNDVAGSPVNANGVESSLSPENKLTSGSSLIGEVVPDSSYSLAEFYEAIADDVRIGPTHICLYVALLNEWDMACANDATVTEKNVLMKKDPIPLDRNVLMKNARISRRTYHKCMRELHEYGYIRYEPSSNPCLRSRVFLRRL